LSVGRTASISRPPLPPHCADPPTAQRQAVPGGGSPFPGHRSPRPLTFPPLPGPFPRRDPCTMRIRTLLFGLAPIAALAQGPEITSWIINPGTETGYGGSLTNVLQVAYTPNDVYVRCSCIPGYDIGPWTGNPNDAMNMDFVFKITRSPQPATGPHTATPMGHIGVWRNGVSIFNAKDGFSYNNQGIWNRDALVFEGLSFDACMGHPAPNGEYHHHVTPNCLYDHMNEVAHSD